MAEKLKDNNIQVIYASPLKWAYETARIIATALGIDEVISDEHLMEREFGILTGKPIADISKYKDKILLTDRVTYFLEAEGVEDFPALIQRAKKILEEVNERHNNKNILIVTHGDIGKMIRAVYHNWTWEQGLTTGYFQNTEILELSDKQDVVE